jgi:hypothetical protein
LRQFAALWIPFGERVENYFARRIFAISLHPVDADAALLSGAIPERQNCPWQLVLRYDPPVAQRDAKRGPLDLDVPHCRACGRHYRRAKSTDRLHADLKYHRCRRREIDDAFPDTPSRPAETHVEHPSEDQIAQAFVTSIGEFTRYVSVWGKWLVWRDTFWETEQPLAVLDLARSICREMGARRQRRGLRALIAG